MDKQNFQDIRKEYSGPALDESSVNSNPFIQFAGWFNEAVKADLPEVNAMTLATVSPEGQPAARLVLLKDFDEHGFVFFTNYRSHKALHLKENPLASLLFFWAEFHWQVRIEGEVKKVPEQESDRYFQTRPRETQIGAFASEQSQVIPHRKYLDNRFKQLEKEFSGKTLSRPSHWGGFRLKPSSFEFWQGRPNRLNDRILYELKNKKWEISRLAP